MGSQGAAHSDVDVLIDPNPAAGFDLIDVVGVKNVLSDQVRVPADVVEGTAIEPRLRERIKGEAEPVF